MYTWRTSSKGFTVAKSYGIYFNRQKLDFVRAEDGDWRWFDNLQEKTPGSPICRPDARPVDTWTQGRVVAFCPSMLQTGSWSLSPLAAFPGVNDAIKPDNTLSRQGNTIAAIWLHQIGYLQQGGTLRLSKCVLLLVDPLTNTSHLQWKTTLKSDRAGG